MPKITEQQFLASTLSPTERENPRTVALQKIAYRRYAERVSLYGDLANLLEDVRPANWS